MSKTRLIMIVLLILIQNIHLLNYDYDLMRAAKFWTGAQMAVHYPEHFLFLN